MGISLELREDMGKKIPSPDNAPLSSSMEKSEDHPLIIGVFSVFTDSESRSRSFRNIMNFGSPKPAVNRGGIKLILTNYLSSN